MKKHFRNIELVAYDNPGSRCIDIFAHAGDEVPVTVGWTTPSVSPDPVFRLETEKAQELMDSLWRCGIRPTEGRGSAGQLAAVERHLLDMRTLTFDKLKCERPRDES